MILSWYVDFWSQIWGEMKSTYRFFYPSRVPRQRSTSWNPSLLSFLSATCLLVTLAFIIQNYEDKLSLGGLHLLLQNLSSIPWRHYFVIYPALNPYEHGLHTGTYWLPSSITRSNRPLPRYLDRLIGLRLKAKDTSNDTLFIWHRSVGFSKSSLYFRLL